MEGLRKSQRTNSADLASLLFNLAKKGEAIEMHLSLPRSMANLSVNRTACKLRLQVPSARRAPAAGYLKRSAS